MSAYPPPPPSDGPPPPPPPGGGYPGGGVPPGPSAVPANNSKATASLVLGILSLFCCGFVLGVVAIVLGLLARGEIERSQGTQGGAGLALGGIITGALGVLSGIAFGIAIFSFGFYDNFI